MQECSLRTSWLEARSLQGSDSAACCADVVQQLLGRRRSIRSGVRLPRAHLRGGQAHQPLRRRQPGGPAGGVPAGRARRPNLCVWRHCGVQQARPPTHEASLHVKQWRCMRVRSTSTGSPCLQRSSTLQCLVVFHLPCHSTLQTFSAFLNRAITWLLHLYRVQELCAPEPERCAGPRLATSKLNDSMTIEQSSPVCSKISPFRAPKQCTECINWPVRRGRGVSARSCIVDENIL